MCSPSRSPLPPSSPPDRSLWLFPVHQVRAPVSCIQPELVICFTLDNIHVSMLRQCIKKQRHYFANKGPYSQSYGFSSGHVWMWQLDHNEVWAPKNWCFQNDLLEKTLESPLDCKEIQPVHPKGTQSWIFTGRTVAKAEVLILWPPDAKSWLIGKDPDAGKDWRQEEKGWQRMRRADGIIDSRGMNLSKLIFVFPVWQDLFISVSLMYVSWGDGRSGTEVILDPWPSSKVTPLPNRTPVIWFPRRLIEISPSWSGKIMTTCLSCPTTVGPDKACRKLTRRICEEPKDGGDTTTQFVL